MATYKELSFAETADAIGVDVALIAKHENLFEAAARWYRLDKKRPLRTAPSSLRRKLNRGGQERWPTTQDFGCQRCGGGSRRPWRSRNSQCPGLDGRTRFSANDLAILTGLPTQPIWSVMQAGSTSMELTLSDRTHSGLRLCSDVLAG